jgi:hypothetical protein
VRIASGVPQSFAVSVFELGATMVGAPVLKS